MEREYLSAAETAKLVRAALKKEFPGTKFSVRSDVYSGGASIRVRYTDGPAIAKVEPVAKQFGGGGFDGMIDMKYNWSSWLLPDGSAMVAENPGTTGSMGVYSPEKNPMPEGAKLVRFGADFIFVDRDLTKEATSKAVELYEAKYGKYDENDVSDRHWYYTLLKETSF